MFPLLENTFLKVSRIPRGPSLGPRGGALPGLPGIRDTLRNVILLYEKNFSRYPVFPRARALALGGCPPWPPWNTGCLEKCFVFTWGKKPSQGIPYSQGGPSPGPRGAGVLTGLPGIRDALRNASFLTKKALLKVSLFPGARALALGGRPPWPPWNTGYIETCFPIQKSPSQGIPYPGGPSPGPRGAVSLASLEFGIP